MALEQFLKERITDAQALVRELRKTFAYVSVLGSYTKTKSILSSTRMTSVDDIDNECGFVIRMYDGSHYSEYSANDIRGLDPQKVISSVQLPAMNQPFVKAPALEEEEMVRSFVREDAGPLSDEEILERLKSIRTYCEQKDERIINVQAACRKRSVSKIFVSEKKVLDQHYEWVNAIMMLSAREGDVIQQHYCTENEADTRKALEELDQRKDSDVDIVLRMLSASPVEPGVYDIITDPTISGLICHEAFGHGVEQDMVVKHRAKSADYVNKRVGSELLNMHDGAAAALSAASYFFDDDGVLAQDTHIIENGILKRGISDALSALQLGQNPSGNGRRESYKRKSYSRMTNTFFSPGNDKVEDMFRSVKHGYYLCNTNNGMEDPKNWQIQCTAEYGLEIRDGELTGKIVAPVVISGSVLDLLNSITMVSDEFRVIGSGSCGKGHKEWVYVSDGGPYMKGRAKLG
ncbi:MAG: TldD/PmbA family protein [Erysipelotrichaceae bacterium]|nr:TldD/PmbA family protein [Erysipelotrichaceae bacterium]